MAVQDVLSVVLLGVGILLFVIGWFVPKWTGLEPEVVITCFIIASLVACITGAINLGLWR